MSVIIFACAYYTVLKRKQSIDHSTGEQTSWFPLKASQNTMNPQKPYGETNTIKIVKHVLSF